MKRFLFVALIFIIFGCKRKYEHCDNATICVKNIGSNKIAYSWGSSVLADTLKPGETTCEDVGEYNADPNNQASGTAYFATNGATWAIKSTSCKTEKEINP